MHPKAEEWTQRLKSAGFRYNPTRGRFESLAGRVASDTALILATQDPESSSQVVMDEIRRYSEEQEQQRIAAYTADDSETATVDDEVSFAKRFIERNQIDVLEAGSTVNFDLRDLKGDVVKYNCAVRRIPKEVKEVTGHKPLLVADVIAAVEAELRVMHGETIGSLKDSLRFDRSLQSESRRIRATLSNILCFPSCPDRRVVTTIFYHMLWQIKRKIFGLEVKDHMLLFLFGPQGCGKTTLLRRIGEPLGSLYAEPRISDLASKFGHEMATNHFMGNMEEFDSSDKSHLAVLKKFITQEFVTERQMFSSTNVRTAQNLTLFASSNRKLKRVIFDSTGMRRFFEIDLSWVGRFLDFDAVNSIDYYALWRGIDESVETPPIRRNAEIYQRILDKQEAWRYKNSVEVWLRQEARIPIDPETSDKIKVAKLFSDYLYWAKHYDPEDKMSLRKFSGLLEDTPGVAVTEDERGDSWTTLNRKLDDSENDDPAGVAPILHLVPPIAADGTPEEIITWEGLL